VCRMSAWSDRVHWESLLDQAFWKLSPGLLLWMSGERLLNKPATWEYGLHAITMN